jgi:hypothetical protein
MGYSDFLTRFFLIWFRITMFFTGWFKTSDVRRARMIDEIPARLEYGKEWRKDKAGGDFVTNPRRVQRRIEDGVRIGDCDDHAAYWCAVLLKSGLAKRCWMGWVMMQPAKGNPSVGRWGHCVCIFEDHDGVMWWTDYHLPKRIGTEQEPWREWEWAHRVGIDYYGDPVCATRAEVTLAPDLEGSIRFWKYTRQEFLQ